MIKKLLEGSCKIDKSDTYLVMIDSVGNLGILLKDTEKDVPLLTILDEGDAMKLANNIIDYYNGRGEYMNV